MEFLNKEYFYLLLLLIPYIVWYVMRHKKSHPSLTITSISSYRQMPKTLRQRLIHLPFLLRIVCLVMIVLVLARPVTTNEWKERNIEGIDIMLAMDISTSMLAEDLRPNRLEAAKEVATQFIQGRPNDNIGLTVFAGEAYTQCPMTVDHASLLNMLHSMDCNMVLKGMLDDGTAIGMGLANAVSRLKESNAKSKVVILLTDGSNNTGDISPLMAADIAAEFGIRVYTIGVGKNGLANYPMYAGGTVQYVKIPVEIDTKTLNEIARKTGGDSYRATSKSKLEDVYHEIDKLEKSKLNVKQFSKHYEAYQLFGWIAVISLLLELLLKLLYFKRLP